jgi:uncharacterized repeat protein (TIGR01451 family)
MKTKSLVTLLLILLLPALSLARITKREGVDIPTKVVIIKEGDTLRKLAEEHLGDRERWREFLKVNIISNPELIMPGERLYVPILPRDTSISNDHPAMLLLQPTEDDTPEADANPVMTEHLIVVKAIDSKGNPVPGVKVEWVLSDFPNSTGDIVEADDNGKINNRYAVTYTNGSSLELSRNPKDGKSLRLGPGETWIGISAAHPGETKLIAICPSIPMDSGRMIYVTCRWLDIAWEFPPDSVNVVNFSDNSRNTVRLETRVFKATNGSPIEGVEVRYSILRAEGLIDALLESGDNEVTVRSDGSGIAAAALKLAEPGLGKVILKAELLDGGGETIGEGKIAVEWKAPQLKVMAFGPKKAGMMEEVKLQIELSNSGTAPASDVRVELLSDAFKPIGQIPNVERIEPGETVKVPIKAIPLKPGAQKCTVSVLSAEGIQSMDEVTLEVSPPKLELSVNGPEMAPLSSQITYTFNLRNDGDRPVKEIKLKAEIPARGMKLINAIDGQADDKGETVTWSVAQIDPGDSTSFTLILSPSEEGIWEIKGEAIYGEMAISDGAITRVSAPKLKLSLSRQLVAAKVGRSYEVELNLTNSGTGDANGVRIEVISPDRVQIRPERKIQMGTIKARESKSVKLIVIPTAPGKHELSFKATCSQGMSAQAKLTMVSVARAEVKISISDSADPVIVGNEFTYTVVVSNTGSAKAESVKITGRFPPKLNCAGAESSIGQVSLQDGALSLDVGDLDPGAKVTITVRVKAIEEGDVVYGVTAQFAGPGGKVSAEEITSIVSLEDKR